MAKATSTAPAPKPANGNGKASAPDGPSAELTIDELAHETGMTARNIRAHQSRGLLPPPEVRARTGYYSADHVARIKLIQDMQSQGFNLKAIERLLALGTARGSENALAFERAILTPFAEEQPEVVRTADLEKAFGEPADQKMLARRRKRARSARSARTPGRSPPRPCCAPPRRWSSSGSRSATRSRSARRSASTRARSRRSSSASSSRTCSTRCARTRLPRRRPRQGPGGRRAPAPPRQRGGARQLRSGHDRGGRAPARPRARARGPGPGDSWTSPLSSRLDGGGRRP